jgi:hypothetical protein
MTAKSYSRIIVFLTVVLSTSCININSKTNINKEPIANRLHLASIEDRFKFGNLKEFDVDTISWDRRTSFYKKIDSLSFFQIYQDTTQEYLGQYPGSIDLDFFYSKQNNKRGLIELTILSQREGEYCDRILYNIYDLSGRLISSFRVAGSCGDGGYYETAHGKFLNDSTYELLSEDNYKTEDVDKLNLITYSKTTTIIKPNGTIVQSDTTLKTETK